RSRPDRGDSDGCGAASRSSHNDIGKMNLHLPTWRLGATYRSGVRGPFQRPFWIPDVGYLRVFTPVASVKASAPRTQLLCFQQCGLLVFEAERGEALPNLGFADLR